MLNLVDIKICFYNYPIFVQLFVWEYTNFEQYFITGTPYIICSQKRCLSRSTGMCIKQDTIIKPAETEHSCKATRLQPPTVMSFGSDQTGERHCSRSSCGCKRRQNIALGEQKTACEHSYCGRRGKQYRVSTWQCHQECVILGERFQNTRHGTVKLRAKLCFCYKNPRKNGPCTPFHAMFAFPCDVDLSQDQTYHITIRSATEQYTKKRDMATFGF